MDIPQSTFTTAMVVVMNCPEGKEVSMKLSLNSTMERVENTWKGTKTRPIPNKLLIMTLEVYGLLTTLLESEIQGMVEVVKVWFTQGEFDEFINARFQVIISENKADKSLPGGWKTELSFRLSDLMPTCIGGPVSEEQPFPCIPDREMYNWVPSSEIVAEQLARRIKKEILSSVQRAVANLQKIADMAR